MGQGAESCGGYEIEYNPYEENLSTGLWEQRNGSLISPSDMTISHLKNTKRICNDLASTASFSCEADKWMEWVEIFNDEIYLREGSRKKAKPSKPAQPQSGSKTKMKCHCGKAYNARNADLKRGWAKSCSKRCAAIKREFGRPDGKPVK